MSVFVEHIAGSISARSRARKLGQFLSLLHPSSHDTVLDIGVNTTEYSESDNYLERHYPYPEKITALGTGTGESFQARYPLVTYVSGDGRTLPFPDQSFDIVYSNAVLEHVGSRENQIAFLREAYRVGRRGFLTTPNRRFPIELHTRVPLLHLFLSQKCFDTFLRRIGKDWAAGDYMHLLTRHGLETLLVEAGITGYHIRRNRFLLFTMTFTVVWTKS